MFSLLPRPQEGYAFSMQLYGVPSGSTSLHAASTNLTSVAQQVQAVLAGHQANSGVMQTAWLGQTGELANAADTPHQAWLQATVAQLEGAAAAAQGFAAAFDTAQMTTPAPPFFHANNLQYPIVVGTMLATLGIMWQPYFLNWVDWMQMTARADAAQGAYSVASGPISAAMFPLTPPPISGTPSGTPGAGAMSGSIPGGMAGQPLESVLQSAAGLGGAPGSAASAAMPAISAATQPLSSATSLVSQPSNAFSSGSQLASTAGPLASSPASGLGGMPSPVGSQGPGAGGPGTNDGTWYGAGTATGGTVAAALTPGVGGGVGMGGLGMAMRPLSGPVSWASTASAAPEANQITFSRFDQTRAAMAGSPTSANMGAPGTMMPPAGRHGQDSAAERNKALDTALATAAVLYRPPRDMPVVTGAAGMQYLAGEEDQ